MSPVTHFLSGWVFANSVKLDRRDRAIVTLACVVPDIDGLGIIPEILTRNSVHPLLWFSLYHHSLHNLAFALVVAAVAFAIASRKWATGLLALLSFHVHLFEDLLGSRGPDGDQWPIPYFSSVLPCAATDLERAMGPECLAQCGAYGCFVAGHILAGVAERVFASRNGLRKSGCRLRRRTAKALPATQ